MPSDLPRTPPPADRLSRRRLLALGALVAAAPLGSSLRPAAAAGDTGDDDAYQRAFSDALAADPNVRRHTVAGREFLYRPRQLLAANADAQRVTTWLRSRGHQVTVGAGFAGVTRLVFAKETDIPTVVSALRNPSSGRASRSRRSSRTTCCWAWATSWATRAARPGQWPRWPRRTRPGSARAPG